MDLICVAQRGCEKGQQLEINQDGKTNSLTSVQKDNLIYNYFRIRRLTPLECCRLQTVNDWYKWEVSETQQYKMLGNGWNIKTIIHILNYWDFK